MFVSGGGWGAARRGARCVGRGAEDGWPRHEVCPRPWGSYLDLFAGPCSPSPPTARPLLCTHGGVSCHCQQAEPHLEQLPCLRVAQWLAAREQHRGGAAEGRGAAAAGVVCERHDAHGAGGPGCKGARQGGRGGRARVPRIATGSLMCSVYLVPYAAVLGRSPGRSQSLAPLCRTCCMHCVSNRHVCASVLAIQWPLTSTCSHTTPDCGAASGQPAGSLPLTHVCLLAPPHPGAAAPRGTPPGWASAAPGSPSSPRCRPLRPAAPAHEQRSRARPTCIMWS